MSNLDSVIKSTVLYQDVDLATALTNFRKSPAELQAFLQKQQSTIYKDIIKQKENVFSKVYGDLNRAAKSQESILMYNERNKQVYSMQDQVYNNQKNMATSIVNDQNLATRKNEMNEWSVGNKNDTLFVYSALFISLSALLLCVVLWKMAIISGYLSGSLMGLILGIFVLILFNRSQYTANKRDQRYWNRKNFGGKGEKIPLPDCPGLMDNIVAGNKAAIDFAQKASNIANTAMTTANSAIKDVDAMATAAASAATDLNKGMKMAMPGAQPGAPPL
jgi:hypothetical protein